MIENRRYKITNYRNFNNILNYHFNKLRKSKNQYSSQKAGAKLIGQLPRTKFSVLNTIQRQFDELLFYPQIIRLGLYDETTRKHNNIFQALMKRFEKLKEFKIFRTESEKKKIKVEDMRKIQDEFIDEHLDYMSVVFNEDKIEELFDEIFAFNDRNYYKNMTQEHIEYINNISYKLVQRGIKELEQHISSTDGKYTLTGLRTTVETCRFISDYGKKKINDIINQEINRKVNVWDV